MEDKHMIGCSASLTFMVTEHIHRYQTLKLDYIFDGGIIIQPTISSMSYPSLPLEQKVVTTSSACDNRKKLDHSCFAGGNVKRYDHSAKQVGSFL